MKQRVNFRFDADKVNIWIAKGKELKYKSLTAFIEQIMNDKCSVKIPDTDVFVKPLETVKSIISNEVMETIPKLSEAVKPTPVKQSKPTEIKLLCGQSNKATVSKDVTEGSKVKIDNDIFTVDNSYLIDKDKNQLMYKSFFKAYLLM